MPKGLTAKQAEVLEQISEHSRPLSWIGGEVWGDGIRECRIWCRTAGTVMETLRHIGAATQDRSPRHEKCPRYWRITAHGKRLLADYRAAKAEQ